MHKYFIAALFLWFWTGCGLVGTEIGRIEINEVGTTFHSTQLAPDPTAPLELWVELDLEFDEELMLYYTIEVWKDSVQISNQRLDGLNPNPRLKSVLTEVNGHTEWSFEGKVGEVDLLQKGTYEVRSYINASDIPSLKLNKAHLVLRQ
ncbi:MAG: hypothetical protein ACFB10_22340 [Salibacteraceae bacterium]